MHICLKFTWFQYTHSHPPWIHFSSQCIWKSLHTILGYTVGWQEVEWHTTCFFFWNYKKYIRNKKAITKKFSTISFPAHSILFLEAGRFLLPLHVFRTPLLAGFRCERGRPYGYRASFQLTTNESNQEKISRLWESGTTGAWKLWKGTRERKQASGHSFPSRVPLALPVLSYALITSKCTVRNLHFPTGQTVAWLAQLHKQRQSVDLQAGQ